MLNAVSATLAISRRPILVAFYDTHGDTPGPQRGDGHVKEPYEMSMAWEPDRRSNFSFGPPAHLCAVTYMTEISLIVTLNN